MRHIANYSTYSFIDGMNTDSAHTSNELSSNWYVSFSR